ncbi:phospholipid-binding protein MlaC [Phocoenobacter skyensis]|uniref:Phospholipid transport system substrate-binding protein n=1 Tax=Phocoenobacter skyensis TaxID=97481 RepID=A0A1H7ZBP2_9PAST|nr:phospholipid-binding protein MlaC [Pasteurella skyensis]MDP8080185.1 phospholipid-binding protein MlaC [Pasteurella skyensis]MDP8086193.1 phospholipid-binding protein MlaC [Pasteurella skyensis]MDP8170147.1 phospholipid-binding protein MlaC [Pasteurella skyensis]MDP8174329.1 phospholipid-binding protein MlaC [Pasteurella skyensis]MDP8185921.1 phospholipid-binding protein MlaC [Pasteurella skyensis]
MIKAFKKIVFTGIIALSTLFSTQVSANTSPYVLMQETADKLFSDIKANQDKINADPNYLRTIVRNDLIPYVHVKYAGLLVLGKYLKKANAQQRNDFFDVFGQFIEQSYAQVLTQYTNQKIEIEKPKSVENKVVVSIRVNILASNNNEPIKLDFKWRKNSKTGEWQAYDMSAEGVSMVATKQNEWSGILRKNGIDALIQRISKSTQKPITLSK